MEEPMTTMEEGAVALHELHVALLAGGFSSDEALAIIVAILRQEVLGEKGS